MERSKSAGGRQLKYRPHVEIATADCSSVQISLRVEDKGRKRIRSVGAMKAIDVGFHTGGRDAKHRSLTEFAATLICAIEVALIVDAERAYGHDGRECEKDGFFAGWSEFEYVGRCRQRMSPK